jgi:hypothetical protein
MLTPPPLPPEIVRSLYKTLNKTITKRERKRGFELKSLAGLIIVSVEYYIQHHLSSCVVQICDILKSFCTLFGGQKVKRFLNRHTRWLSLALSLTIRLIVSLLI